MIAITLTKINIMKPAINDANVLKAVMNESFAEVIVTQLLIVTRVKVANKEIINVVVNFLDLSYSERVLLFFPLCILSK